MTALLPLLHRINVNPLRCTGESSLSLFYYYYLINCNTKAKKSMETGAAMEKNSEWNVRGNSDRLGRRDRHSVERIDGGVRERATSAANNEALSEYTEVPVVFIKTERETDDSEHSRESHVQDEDVVPFRQEEKVWPPSVLQPQTAPRPIPMSAQEYPEVPMVFIKTERDAEDTAIPQGQRSETDFALVDQEPEGRPPEAVSFSLELEPWPSQDLEPETSPRPSATSAQEFLEVPVTGQYGAKGAVAPRGRRKRSKSDEDDLWSPRGPRRRRRPARRPAPPPAASPLPAPPLPATPQFAQVDVDPLPGTSSAIVTVKVEPCEVFDEPAPRNFSEVPSYGSDCKKDITKAKANICECDCSKLNAMSQSGSENTEEKPYKCKQCENVASRPRKIKVIMRCQTRGKPYKCEQCRYSTSHVSHLKRHMRVHTGERPYKCEQCKYSASEIDSLKRHLRTHTGEKPFECEQCAYTTSHISHLKRHMRIHTGEKPYECHQCGYSASEIGSLKRHVRTHTGEKPYKCNRCEYSAAELGSLKRHLRTHTSEKPYKCQQCEYSSTQSGNLKIHMKTHMKKGAKLENTHANSHEARTSEKPYKCQQCEYSATQSGDLEIHMRTHMKKGAKLENKHANSHEPHTSDKPYKCQQCEYSATQSGDLEVHMRTHVKKEAQLENTHANSHEEKGA